MRHAKCAHATCAHARIALVKLVDDLKSGVRFLNADTAAIIIGMHRRHVAACAYAHACSRMFVAFVHACCAFGMDSAALRTRRSALHHAARNGHVDVVRRLLEVDGIDVNARADFGYGRVVCFFLYLCYPKRRTCDNGGYGCFFVYYVRLLRRVRSCCMFLFF